jgi:hypothetical protein
MLLCITCNVTKRCVGKCFLDGPSLSSRPHIVCPGEKMSLARGFWSAATTSISRARMARCTGDSIQSLIIVSTYVCKWNRYLLTFYIHYEMYARIDVFGFQGLYICILRSCRIIQFLNVSDANCGTWLTKPKTFRKTKNILNRLAY